MPRYRAVLFDLDGTLLDTLEDLADSYNAALEQCGFPSRPLQNYRYYVGDGVENAVRRALPAGAADPETVERVATLAREEYRKRWDEKTRPYDGVPEMLRGLADRGLKLAVLSNKDHAFTEQCVDGLLGEWDFDCVLGVGNGVPIKPDPTGARMVMEALCVPAEDFLYLGDTATDMRTAVAAGMCPVGALWGFRDAEELRNAGAKHLISDPRDLLGLL